MAARARALNETNGCRIRILGLAALAVFALCLTSQPSGTRGARPSIDTDTSVLVAAATLSAEGPKEHQNQLNHVVGTGFLAETERGAQSSGTLGARPSSVEDDASVLDAVAAFSAEGPNEKRKRLNHVVGTDSFAETERGALGVTLLSTDLRKLHRSFFTTYEIGKSLGWNARCAFQHFIEKGGLKQLDDGKSPLQDEEEKAFRRDEGGAMQGETLTPEEEKTFKRHFMAEVDVEVNADHLEQIQDPTERNRVWKQEVGKALQDQKPLSTQSYVQMINSRKLGWTAKIVPDLTMADARDLCGAKEGSLEDDDSHSLADNASLMEVNWSSAKATKEILPHAHDSRSTFPECKEVIKHQRNQGKCGSCWAQVGVHVLEARLCIDTRGAFNSWLSSLYATACFPQKEVGPRMFFGLGPRSTSVKEGDGCTRSWSENVWIGAKVHGIPSGSSGPGVGDTCVPYNLGGDALQHFDPNRRPRAPKCFSECTNKEFGRPLQKDLYKLDVAYKVLKGNLNEAKKYMVEGGLVAMGYAVFRDFFSYKEGIYSASRKDMDDGSRSGQHAVSCFGYTRDYLNCKNSWGIDWGERGDFRLSLGSLWLLDCTGCGFKALKQINLKNSNYPKNTTNSRPQEVAKVEAYQCSQSEIPAGKKKFGNCFRGILEVNEFQGWRQVRAVIWAVNILVDLPLPPSDPSSRTLDFKGPWRCIQEEADKDADDFEELYGQVYEARSKPQQKLGEEGSSFFSRVKKWAENGKTSCILVTDCKDKLDIPCGSKCYLSSVSKTPYICKDSRNYNTCWHGWTSGNPCVPTVK